MPDDLDARFQEAAAAAQDLPSRPDNDTLLRLYALYKQATAGDVSGKRPGFTNPVGRAKYDAWDALEGTDADVAKQDYVDLVSSLQG
ncbi:MAG: acyl-CoA-binding protein [Bacteroidota bacterium]